MIKKIIWWCAGADIQLLSQSSYTDKQRYLSIGATVIITSILSTFSAYYAFYSLTENIISSFILGLMWGILITSLNRLVFVSIKGFDKPLNSTMLSLVPRVLIAISIAFTLALPLQLKLFDGSIKNVIAQQRQEFITNIQKKYIKQVDLKINQKKILENQYLDELEGKSVSGKYGEGAVAKTLRERIQAEEDALTKLTIEFEKYRQEIIDKKIGLLDRIEALNKLRNQSKSMNWIYISFFWFFLLLELMPIILKLSSSKGHYETLVEHSEFFKVSENKITNYNTQVTEIDDKEESKSIFENYCRKIISDIEFQSNKSRVKATELLRTGIIIIISGILCYIGTAYLLVGVFLETHEFKPYYIYFMISLSLLFIFIQFLGGWFLNQNKRILNISLYLRSMKPNIDKYLLSYYAICELSTEEEKKHFTKDLLLVLSSEFKNIDSQLLNSHEENFAREVTDSINSLKGTITNFANKLK